MEAVPDNVQKLIEKWLAESKKLDGGPERDQSCIAATLWECAQELAETFGTK